MSYRINPVKATCMKYQGQDHGIQGINDTCFGICAAYSQTNDVYDMDPMCSQACTDLVEKRKYEIFGVGSCDHQVPYRPVIWQQTPRYVPQLLKQGYSPNQALVKCQQLCVQHSNTTAEECVEKCTLDFNAIEPFEEKKPLPPASPPQNSVPTRLNISEESRHHPALFWSIVAIALAFIIGLLILSRRSN